MFQHVKGEGGWCTDTFFSHGRWSGWARCQGVETTQASPEHSQLLNKPLDKRPQVIDPEMYAQAAFKLVRLAIVLDGFSDYQIEQVEEKKIRKLIMDRILGLPERARVPIFAET